MLQGDSAQMMHSLCSRGTAFLDKEDSKQGGWDHRTGVAAAVCVAAGVVQVVLLP